MDVSVIRICDYW